MSTGRRIVLATFGTYGDLHPFIAVALRLRAHGFTPIIATSSNYRDKVESAGIEFRRLRPEQEEIESDLRMTRAQLLRRVARHPQFVVRDMLLPYLQQSYEDSLQAIADADLVVTHTTALATKIAAEKLRCPHLGVVLQPMALLSAYDPPELPPAPALMRWIYARGFFWRRVLVDVLRRVSRRWAAPIDRLRRTEGLPPADRHPFFEGQFSSEGALALYSRVLGESQPDHPPHTTIAGFAFYDSAADGSECLDPALEAFLTAGVAPLVFTLGTSAVHDADAFIRTSLAAITALDCRAVFVLDEEGRAQWQAHTTERILFCSYAPYSLLFARAAVIVHHGGVGTTAQALRSGRPQLIVPYLVDQPDNAARVQRMGAGRAISQRRYTPQAAVKVLKMLMHDATVAQRAQDAARVIASEDGAGTAVRVIERILGVVTAEQSRVSATVAS